MFPVGGIKQPSQQFGHLQPFHHVWVAQVCRHVPNHRGENAGRYHMQLVDHRVHVQSSFGTGANGQGGIVQS